MTAHQKSAQIAVLGTGHMGAPIAQRLLAAGHQLTVWNRTPARTAPLVLLGAGTAASPVDAVRNAEVVITMLTDAIAVDDVLFGIDGAAAALQPGSTLVEMSTIGPAAVRELARRLPDGVHLVDAPVGGSVTAARTGELRVFVGGEDADVERVAGVLDALGTVRRCGGIGGGAALKLVLNTALISAVAALADTLAVADAVAVSRDFALEHLATGPLSGAVKRANATGSSFSIALAGKDIDLALAALAGAPGPIAHASAKVLRAATDQAADIATIV